MLDWRFLAGAGTIIGILIVLAGWYEVVSVRKTKKEKVLFRTDRYLRTKMKEG